MKLKLLLSVLLFAGSMNLYARQCWNSNGQNTPPYNVNLNISTAFTAENNQVGASKVVYNTQVIGSSVGVSCGWGGSSTDLYWYRHYVTDLPLIPPSKTQIRLNDYMAGIMYISQWGESGEITLPTTKRYGPNENINSGGRMPVHDYQYRLSLMIIKPFIGGTTIPQQTIYTVYASTTPSEPLIYPVYTIGYYGKITAPQNCQINSGTTIDLDFKNISANDFMQAGAGNKPSSVTEQNKTVTIQCSNMQSVATLTMRLEAEKSQGDMMVSNNPDIGFKLSDMNGNILIPNNINSFLPFTLQNDYAEILLKAWPVSITGQKPATGAFNSRGILRVDFQ